MISLAQATIESIVIHKIKVVANEEEGTQKEVFTSKNEIQFLDEQTQEILKSYFSLALKSPDLYRFIDNHNLVASECENVFEKKTKMYDASLKFLDKLSEVIEGKDINPMELYVAHFTNCEVDDQFVDAIGIFTSENKETFLKILQNENEINFKTEDGISLKKLNKGCIIFNVTEEDSYIVKAQDNTKGDDVYWIDNFLEAKAIENEYFNDGKKRFKNDKSNAILCQITIVFFQKKREISFSTSAGVGAVSRSFKSMFVMKLTIFLSSFSSFSGRSKVWYWSITFPSTSISTIHNWIGSSLSKSSPVVSKSSPIYLYFGDNTCMNCEI